ncbi:MAG: response regulator transcription factor [Planctomycetes bacterium]|nr:response regulator transcription factor [Planctomycetota bacterium]
MARETILVIEDEEDIGELVRYNLAAEGYQVFVADSGEDGLKLARSKKPSLIILDLMLPGIDGLEVCKSLRKDTATDGIAIVMLTAKGEETDIVIGLELGADDYIVKPFSPKVLIARIKAVLRRKSRVITDEKAVIKAHDLAITPGRREVLLKGKKIDLTFTEFSVLHLLARRPGWVFTRNQILEAARGHDALATDRAVDVQIVGLRKKLKSAGNYIETVRGVGYRFKE